MIIRLGTDEEKELILTKYPYTSRVICLCSFAKLQVTA